MDAIQMESLPSYWAEVQRKLESEPMPEAMDLAKQAMQEGQRINFARQSTREGTAWPARKPPTGNWPFLNQSGALQDAATGAGPGAIERVAGREVSIGVDKGASTLGGIPGAAVHQYGYAKRNIPARPFIGAPDEVEDAIGEMIADHGLRFF